MHDLSVIALKVIVSAVASTFILVLFIGLVVIITSGVKNIWTRISNFERSTSK